MGRQVPGICSQPLLQVRLVNKVAPHLHGQVGISLSGLGSVFKMSGLVKRKAGNLECSV